MYLKPPPPPLLNKTFFTVKYCFARLFRAVSPTRPRPEGFETSEIIILYGRRVPVAKPARPRLDRVYLKDDSGSKTKKKKNILQRDRYIIYTNNIIYFITYKI